MKTVKAIWALVVSACVKWLYRLKAAVVDYLLKVRGRLQIQSLRQAIHGADKDKERTGRKNMVVYNTASGEYEPIQKRLLKNAARATKNKSNRAQTEGARRMQQKRRKRILDADQVHTIEKKSLYVTD